jgi:hypothetical protein
MPMTYRSPTPCRALRCRAIRATALCAAGLACVGCWSADRPEPAEPALSPAERAFEQQVQDGVDRFARLTRHGPHAVQLTLGAPRRPAARRVLAEVLARQAFASLVSSGDTVRIAMHAPRRLGPLALGGTTQHYTFTAAPPARAPAAKLLP